MYLLQDLLGEDVVNGVLRGCWRSTPSAARPTRPSRCWSTLRAVTPPDKAYLIDDLFESIVLYENRADSASARRRPDGKYEVTIRATAGKVRAGELGEKGKCR
jgi:ABC-2 type transport system permease protein